MWIFFGGITGSLTLTPAVPSTAASRRKTYRRTARINASLEAYTLLVGYACFAWALSLWISGATTPTPDSPARIHHRVSLRAYYHPGPTFPEDACDALPEIYTTGLLSQVAGMITGDCCSHHRCRHCVGVMANPKRASLAINAAHCHELPDFCWNSANQTFLHHLSGSFGASIRHRHR